MNESAGNPFTVESIRSDPYRHLMAAVVACAARDARGRAKKKKEAAIEWLQSDYAAELLEDLGFDTRIVRQKWAEKGRVEFVRIRSSEDEEGGEE